MPFLMRLCNLTPAGGPTRGDDAAAHGAPGAPSLTRASERGGGRRPLGDPASERARGLWANRLGAVAAR